MFVHKFQFHQPEFQSYSTTNATERFSNVLILESHTTRNYHLIIIIF